MSPERSPIAMKDIKWLSQNCTVGFLVAGMWNNRYYSNASTTITTCNRASGHDMLASGDAEGYIRLFRYLLLKTRHFLPIPVFALNIKTIFCLVCRYPCISNRGEYHETKSYSGAIGSVRFLYGDRSLISVGGTDASLLIWDVIEE